nr:MAG TPA: hypothetical protein [Bacteriophage sp.]
MDNEMEKLIEAIKDLSNVVNTIKAEQLRRVDRPEVLYAIENINTGEITFNARGGAYRNVFDAIEKMQKMGQNEHRIVEYRLEK